MNKYWKFQENILILVWIRAERLKICCNQWPPDAEFQQSSATGGHWLQQIFSLSALNQTRIKISSWKFQHLFITWMCKSSKSTFMMSTPYSSAAPPLIPAISLALHLLSFSFSCFFLPCLSSSSLLYCTLELFSPFSSVVIALGGNQFCHKWATWR